MDGLSQRNYKTEIKNRDRAIMAVSGAINCQNMAIYGAINCKNTAISGAINSQKGRQILYQLPIPGEAQAKVMPGWLYIHIK